MMRISSAALGALRTFGGLDRTFGCSAKFYGHRRQFLLDFSCEKTSPQTLVVAAPAPAVSVFVVVVS